MNVATWVWWTTIIVTLGVLAFDVVIIGRRPHEPSRTEVTVALSFYVGLAVVFGLGVAYFAGGQYGTEFFAGWITEYSLSIDNLFIFILILSRFGVPRELHQSALIVGIVLALLMRGVFIGVGAAAINTFSWVFYLFGAFLVYTAVGLVRGGGGHDDDGDGAVDYRDTRLVRLVTRRLPATPDYHGSKLVATEGGRRLITPMFVVVVALGTTDLIFALDSIPAIYGLTNEAYLVLTANIFALMGLRQLYFLLGGLLRRLIYLSYGLAFLLAFIGMKLILHAMHENSISWLNDGQPIDWAPDISTWVSLAVIVVTLAVTTVASLAVSRRRDRLASAEEPAG